MEGDKMVDDKTNHRGQGWYFSSRTRLIFGRAQNVDDVHDTFVARIYEEVIDRRCHQVEGIMKRTVIGTMIRTHA